MGYIYMCLFVFVFVILSLKMSPDVRQRLGKRPHSPEIKAPSSTCAPRREPISDVHSRLGIPKQDVKGLYSDTREKKSG